MLFYCWIIETSWRNTRNADVSNRCRQWLLCHERHFVIGKQFAVRHIAVIFNVRMNVWRWSFLIGQLQLWIENQLCACVHFPIGSHIVSRLSSLHCRISEPCHRTFETATIVNEASCTNQYITPHPHHSNNTKQHAYFNTHQWWLQITIQQSNAVGD